jgi:hypothetical protein
VGKRSAGQFERKPRDLYPTPYEAVLPLLPHLQPETRFIEPCAGDGRLIGYLQEHGHICEAAFDIEPLDPCIIAADARRLRATGWEYDEIYYITNPPWDRALLHEIIVALSSDHPTWLLFDADWMHTKQARKLLRRCRRVVSVGRVKWEPDSKHQGKDNAAWYLFTATESEAPPLFHGRG